MNIERFFRAPITMIVMIFYFLLGLLSLYNNLTGEALLLEARFNMTNTMIALALPLLYLGGRITYEKAPKWVSAAIVYVILAVMILSVVLSNAA